MFSNFKGLAYSPKKTVASKKNITFKKAQASSFFNPNLISRNNFSFPSYEYKSYFLFSNLPIKPIRKKYIEKQIEDICTSEKVKFNLNQVGGLANILGSLTEVIDYLKNPNSFSGIGNNPKPPKNILLYGPPGTGKTMIAKAIAGHAGVPLFLLSGADLIGQYIGEGERLIRDFFNSAKKTAREENTCVICVIDEIDAIGGKRNLEATSGGNKSYNSLLTQLLSKIGQDSDGVFLIATTNVEPKSLDEALIRPGRFDQHIFIPLPHEQDREKILKLHSQGKEMWDINFPALAKFSEGFPGAKLATWINQAAILAKQKKSTAITMAHFDQAYFTMEFGIPSDQEHDLETRKKIAIHQAGRGLVGHFLGKKLHKMTIRPYGNNNGFTAFVPSRKSLLTFEDALDNICFYLAGRAAEKIFDIEQFSNKDNLEKAKALALKIITEEGLGETLMGINPIMNVENMLQQQFKRAQQFLYENQKQLDAIINALIKHSELDEKNFQNVLQGKPVEKVKEIISSPATPFFSSSVYHLTVEDFVKAVRINSSDISSFKADDNKRHDIIFNENFSETTAKKIINLLYDYDENIRLSYHPHKKHLVVSSHSYKSFVDFIKKSIAQQRNEVKPRNNYSP